MATSRILAIALAVSSLACADETVQAEDEAGTTTAATGTESESGDSSGSDTDVESDATSLEDSMGVTFFPDDDVHGDPHCDTLHWDCPEGEKCVPYSSAGETWDANKCVPVLGDAAPNEACQYDGIVTSTDDCDASSFCFFADARGQGRCLPLCSGTWDDPLCPDEFAGCMIANEQSLALCMQPCDPLVADACSPGDTCVWLGLDAFHCQPALAEGAIGDPCENELECAYGSTCAAAAAVPGCEAEWCCTAYCDVNLEECPLPGTTCDPAGVEGHESLGVCRAA